MPSRAVIHFLCTFKLTVEQHFCSIFEHNARLRTGPSVATSFQITEEPQLCAQEREHERGFIKRNVSI